MLAFSEVLYLRLWRQKAQRNKEDCLIIADRAQQLTEAMIEALGDQQADIDPRLVRDLDRFQE